MSNIVATKRIGNDYSKLVAIRFYKLFEKPYCGLGIAFLLQENIYDLSA